MSCPSAPCKHGGSERYLVNEPAVTLAGFASISRLFKKQYKPSCISNVFRKYSFCYAF